MNKAEIIKEIGKILPDKKEAKVIVDKIFDIIISTLKHDEKVVISKFGSFRSKIVPARQYRNPKTGETVTLPPRKAIRFKASEKTF
ncbi:MAG TPA: HU family DNA-binding protein [Elusimicrobiales bacterium]|nr:HU family DNA-binding protein [Elusimicrobiales bacterium]